MGVTPSHDPRIRITPRHLFAAALLGWLITETIALVLGAPLKHDEAAYGVLARGEAVDWIYRSRGVVVLAEIGIALGGSDLAMRLAPALLDVALVLAIGALGRRALGPGVGAWTAVVIVGTVPILLRVSLLLPDASSTALLLVAIAILVDQLERPEGPSYRLVAAAPALAGGFYLRYGNAPIVLLIGISALVLWRHQLRRRPGPIVTTIGVLAGLLAPFALISIRETGSLVGILELASAVSGRAYLGQGLVVMLTSNPVVYFGALAAPCVLAGLASVVWPPRDRLRPARYLAVIALGQIAMVGLSSVGTPRYLLLAIILLVMLGVDGILRALAGRERLVVRAGLPLVLLAWIAGGITLVLAQRSNHGKLGPIVDGALAIRDHAAGAPCTVIARGMPQLMWYSGCNGAKLDEDGLPPLDPARRWYVANASNRAIDPAVIAPLTGAVTIVPLAPGAWYLQRD